MLSRCQRWSVCFLLACGVYSRAQHGGIAEPAEYSLDRMLTSWEEQTEGTNLALSRPVTFSPTPEYHLTSEGGSDAQDLVDGALCRRSNQAIWWEPKAVGWKGNAGRWNTIIIDLGEPKAVQRIVWRVVAGCRKRNFYGPRRVRLSGGLDGRYVHVLRERLRWRDDVAATDTYRLPNLGPPDSGDDVYIYPIVVEADNARMRYVVLQFEMDGNWLASDELAVLAGEGQGSDISQRPRTELQTRDVWVRSDEPEYPVVPDVAFPLWLRQTDLRPDNAKLFVRYEFRVPEGVTLTAPPYFGPQKAEPGVLAYRYGRGGNSIRIGPLFIQGIPSGDGVMEIRAIGKNAEAQPWQQVRLRPAELPPPFRLKRLSASIGWMVDRQQALWPDFEVAYARLGFNTVPTFPRAWASRALKEGLPVETVRQSPDPGSLSEGGRRLKRLRELGYRVVYMESPIHSVNWRHPEDAKEFKCQIPGNVPREPSFCPSYRGQYFEEEIQRIADHALMVGPHEYVLWDWEIAGSGMWLGKRCTRCQAAFKASGLEWEAFVKRQTLEILDALNAAVRDGFAAKGWTPPELGMYNQDTVETYCGVFDFLQDKRLELQSPSLYVGDDPGAVHDRIRAARERGGNNRIIPWLTTGTYGRVRPVSSRVMVWETLLNGAGGVTYFCFADFNPAHTLEVSRALAAVAPLEDVIADGTPAHGEIRVHPGSIRHSAMRIGKHGGLLLANPGAEPCTAEWAWIGTNAAGRATIFPGDAVLLDLQLR
ncbi:MAG: hypothetical protein HN742_23275 [Lentisphaerae bacterium]|jgi:hypothetical protein|nr:hypothetical protein [Lentisphaerota bacterium]MBT5608394.1 hypothetical protein [Lentisphaerota bacterium]MBT7054986.1 hypothetical protein [Lentisphaerota bacterium]MBT7844817.1 hypothetical protein [Lentisphaerota bacterium]